MHTADISLSHFGVKGMKWGVRQNRTYATEDKGLRKESRQTLAKASGTTLTKRFMTGEISKDEYSKMSTGKEFVNKGSILRRVTTSSDPSINQGRLYVSKLNADSNLYRAVLPANDRPMFNFGGRKSYKQNYELELKTVKRLSAPSEKERVDTFIELMSQPAIKIPGRKKLVTGRDYLSRVGFGHEIKSLSDQEVGLRFYRGFNESAGLEKLSINTAYFNGVRAKGYNAISDDNDRGFLAKAPMMLLDPQGSVVIKSLRPLSADEINRAQRALSANVS